MEVTGVTSMASDAEGPATEPLGRAISLMPILGKAIDKNALLIYRIRTCMYSFAALTSMNIIGSVYTSDRGVGQSGWGRAEGNASQL